jgi:transcriptional/translational regulatory protein YebC/TACO1
MGRIFEVRKSSMFARYDRMAKQFSRVGKEIAIAVKEGWNRSRTANYLTPRRVMQNAKSFNMPKDRIEAAIKNAMGKDTSNYDEVLYEGLGTPMVSHCWWLLLPTIQPALLPTCAAILIKVVVLLGNGGSVSFLFKHLGMFKLKPEGLNMARTGTRIDRFRT